MYREAVLSHLLGFITQEQVMRIKAVIDSYGLPSEMPPDLNVDRLLASMQLDKKTEAGQLKCILPEKIGAVRIHKGITEKAIRESLVS
jgi:3-dehydroquinate synthase